MADLLVWEKPDLNTLPGVIKKAIVEGRVVIIIGECSIEYEGRSASRLGNGERILIIKQDGSVLVHRPQGYSPVNWQPETSVIEVWTDDEVIEDKRTGCRACVNVTGCPTLYIEDGKAKIVEDDCTGCGLCARFCPYKAIVEVSGA
ncbi:indolepyruvate ferredoxin oxidoreductase, alpha subunit [Desulfurococcus amylolyticus 1221n]|uniref:Indolepyruvate ferredoxin oxidoreductase, alpha subunit n=1 Tax=Desulfurococcus amylolyticus (strain DSM 18924 / JCM 16383 / VKM B-2413 / 1221n) TaxID=490899 RepID=B8D2R2_DESA1|nr:4Fe-4S binding protein [Desulfurococcus amylolyticus]ACL10433.1 indolepyruvate ferredoxin oxidoreductase, alpha subunit [Desulfurococcus amylolyticus 1221n]